MYTLLECSRKRYRYHYYYLFIFILLLLLLLLLAAAAGGSFVKCNSAYCDVSACHLAGTLVLSQVALYYQRSWSPAGSGDLGIGTPSSH